MPAACTPTPWASKETGRCVYKLRDCPELNPGMAKPLLLILGEDGPRFQWGKAPLL